MNIIIIDVSYLSFAFLKHIKDFYPAPLSEVHYLINPPTCNRNFTRQDYISMLEQEIGISVPIIQESNEFLQSAIQRSALRCFARGCSYEQPHASGFKSSLKRKQNTLDFDTTNPPYIMVLLSCKTMNPNTIYSTLLEYMISFTSYLIDANISAPYGYEIAFISPFLINSNFSIVDGKLIATQGPESLDLWYPDDSIYFPDNAMHFKEFCWDKISIDSQDYLLRTFNLNRIINNGIEIILRICDAMKLNSFKDFLNKYMDSSACHYNLNRIKKDNNDIINYLVSCTLYCS